MAKIYGTPIMAGGAGGANKDLPPLLDNFKAKSMGVVPLPLDAEGTVEFSTLPSGTKVRMTPNNPYYAVVTHSRTDNNDVAIVYDATSVDLSDVPDSPKMENDSAVAGFDGSDFQQWLSGTSITEWFTATAQNSTAPDFANMPGFLYRIGLSSDALLNTNFSKIHMQASDNGSFVVIHCDTTKKYDFFPEDLKYNDGPYYIYTPNGKEFGIQYDMKSVSTASTYVSAPTFTINESYFPSSGLFHAILCPKPTTKVKQNGDEYYFFEEAESIELSADKMSTSRANELAGAVWVYGDHEPTSVNDGTKIQLTREEVVTSDGGEAQTVTKTVEWNIESNFFARQFTYNSKKQYQTMLEGAIATLVLTGVPDPVTELAEQHSGSSITLTWKNPTSDEFYDHTVVVYKTDAFPTAIDDGTQGYSGTDETATLSGLKLGSTYYIAVFTVSAYGLYGEPQTVQVEIPAGQLLSSLASGTKVKLGKWNNTDLQWKVARDTSDQKIRLVLEPTSVSLLGNKMYDNKEPSNSDPNRRNYGNNRYIYSNIHQWLNATEATGWYTAQHSTDAAPDYSSQAGFLSGWSENHIAALDRATLTTSRASVDGGGTETFVSRVALMSTTELGFESGTGNGRLDIFNSNGDRATGSYYWTRKPYPSNSNGVGLVNTAGALYMFSNASYANGVRPLCSPKSTALVSLEMDGDNCYVVQ
mgnify:CR=1 FL=1